MDRKERQVERYLRQIRHQRTRAEEKELEREASARRAARRDRGRRRHDWIEEADETHERERIPRSPRFHRAAGDRRPEIPATAVDGAVEEAGAGGLVLSLAPGRARVLIDGREHDVDLAGELARAQQSRVAVGDELVLEERGDGSLRARAVLPRRSTLSRPDPAHPTRERVLAANVDRAVVVVAVRRPSFRARLIDRYLVAVRRGGVEAVVCANKIDLVESASERRELDTVLAIHRDLGVPALFTSVATGEGIAELRDEIAGRTVVFVGQSGVGKSSLLNALKPDLGLSVGDVRAGDGKGRHTTTSSTLLELGNGTRVIDTPGIRALGLFDVDRRTLALYFPELAEASADCRFRDCSHRHEPDCEVRDRVDQGVIARQRYEAYLRIHDSL